MTRGDKQILCPKCEYRPQVEDRWQCIPRCGTLWHTFWTGGVCPGCGLAWPMTQCPSCGRISPHKAWYREPEQQIERQRERDLERTDT